MNQLIAKIRDKGKTVNKYYKVLSDVTLFNIPDNLVNAIAYNPNTKLDDGDWFIITEFSKKKYCLDVLKQDFNSVDYNPLNTNLFTKLDFIFLYFDGNYFFQNISRTQLVRKKIIFFGEQFSFDNNNASIIIKEIPDAIYIKKEDCLYFYKLSSIASIFLGIEVLHREATEKEVKNFLNSGFITLTNGFSSTYVKTQTRKNIALAIDVLNNFENDDKEAIFEYTHNYCPGLAYTNNTFSIGSEDDLKLLLFGIGQRFYTTPIGNERRIANSIISMEKEVQTNG